MSAPAGFEPVAEVAADDQARIAFGRAGVRRNDRFLVSTRPTGEILLTPPRAASAGATSRSTTTPGERASLHAPLHR